MGYSGVGCTSCYQGSPRCTTQFRVSPPSTHPHALTHQDALVSAICHILRMRTPFFVAFCRNDSLDKAIRNFQYIVEEVPSAKVGKPMCPYHNKHYGPRYFRRTDEAEKILGNGGHAGEGGDVHYEHAVPVTVVKDQLLLLHSSANSNSRLWDDVKDALMASEIVLVSHPQRKVLDGAVEKGGLGLQRRMPHGWNWGDCHLARICSIRDPLPITIVGNRMIG